MLLRIKVKPGSKKDEIAYEADRTLTIKIRAQPVDGKANKYLVEFLSETFKVPKSGITLLKGDSSRYKTVQIDVDEKYGQEILRKATAPH